MTAKQVGEALGFSGRSITLWTEGKKWTPPCPHLVEHHGQRPRLLFDLDEVKAWRKGQGLTEDKSERIVAPLFVEQVASREVRDASWDARPVGGAVPRTGPAGEIQSSDRSGLAFDSLALSTELLNKLKASVASKEGISSAQVQQITAATRHLESISRLQREAQNDEAERAGEVMDRRVALEILKRVTAPIRTKMTALQHSVPASIRQMLSRFPTELADTEAWDRVVAVAVREAVDAALADLARVVMRSAEDLGSGKPVESDGATVGPTAPLEAAA